MINHRLSRGKHCHSQSFAIQVEIPEWYTRGQLPPVSENPYPTVATPARDDPLHFSVLEGSVSVLNECQDSLDFMQLLADLCRFPNAKEAASELPESKAARSLFQHVSIISQKGKLSPQQVLQCLRRTI